MEDNGALVLAGSDVALSKQEKDWIQQQIDASQKKHGGARSLAWLKDWGALAVLVTMALAVGSQWTSYVVFRTKTEDALTRIEQELPGTSLRQSANLPLEDFQKSLREVHASLSALRKQGQTPAGSVLQEVRQKLIDADSNSPSYWPAVADVVSYQAQPQQSIPAALEALVGPPTANKGDCYARPFTTYHAPNIPNSLVLSTITLHDCTLKIDDIPALVDFLKANHFRSYETTNLVLTLVRVRVVYDGGTLPRLFMLAMYDCTYDFQVQSTPPPNGIKMLETLLKTDPKKDGETVDFKGL